MVLIFCGFFLILFFKNFFFELIYDPTNSFENFFNPSYTGFPFFSPRVFSPFYFVLLNLEIWKKKNFSFFSNAQNNRSSPFLGLENFFVFLKFKQLILILQYILIVISSTNLSVLPPSGFVVQPLCHIF
ncbi:MAG: hypothetical protein CM15mL4_0040 [uncultured marine virus]|nr:MAG: hypothetical protein CM15mL4_0040 [uncultured marine virus]